MKINFRSRLALIFALVAMAFSNATADETFQSILGPMRGNGDTNVNMTVPATTQLLFANAGMTFI